MDRYIYLIIGLYFLGFWLIIFLQRDDLRGHLLWTGLAGGIGSLLSEFWFRADYWHPPHLVGWHGYSLEDFLFGFALTGCAIAVYPMLLGAIVGKKPKLQRPIIQLVLLGGSILLVFFIFNYILHLGSGVASLISLAVCAFSLGLSFPPLREHLIITASSLILLTVPLYIFLFDVLAPTWWQHYLVPAGTPIGVLILGNLPLLEILWIGCFAATASGIYSLFFLDN